VKVLVVARPGVGGVARVLETMFRRLPSRGVEGTAVLSGLEGTQMLDVARKHGWDAVRLDMKREVAFFSDAFAVAKLRREFPGHDLIHAHAAKAGALVRLARPRVPVVYAPHGFYFSYHEEGSKPYRRYLDVEKKLAPGTSLLHCVSSFERDLAVANGLIDAADAVVLPNPVPPRRADAPRVPPPPENERIVLMAALLAGSRVAVLSSRSEAMPLFLLEAMAEGVAIVSTDLPGCREAAGDAALYVPPGDAKALAVSITALLLDAKQRKRLRENGRLRLPLFDEDRWLTGLVAMYERALGR
jgi:glycosyltransferase involved in cell wall biosynthesis